MLGGVAAFAMLAASAWAQDYTVTTATNLLEARPASATMLPIDSSHSANDSILVNLPFEFTYYGKLTTDVIVAAHGWIIPGAASEFPNSAPTSPHGQDSTSGAFPYSPGANSADGFVAALWSGNWRNINTGSGGACYVWTTGTAPNRHFVVSWENGGIGPIQNANITVQVHLHEGSGRIVFAYTTNSSGYGTTNYVCGLDSPTDSRYTAPLLNSTTNSGYPGSDFIFDPRTVTYSGTLLYDKLASDSSGIGNSLLLNQPLGEFPLELRANGVLASRVTTGSDGTFSITGIGVPSTTGVLALLAQNTAARVTTNGIAPTTEWVINGSLSLASTSVIGTVTLGATADPTASLRASFNIALTCSVARGWAVARISDSIPSIEIHYNDSDGAATAYTPPVGTSSALLRIGSTASLNPDAWDDAMVTHSYARHLLASIASYPTSSADARFDAVSDEQNAFAEGFGYYVWAAVSGTSQAIDGTSSSTATVHDLESPTVTVVKGPDVAGCAAGAIFDLLDPANETGDTVDGTLTPDRVLTVTETFTVAPKLNTFLQAWADASYDSSGITRVFIANRVLADDAFEPNDDRTEAPSAGLAGFLPKTLVLNRFNDDWLSVTLPAAAAALMADVKYDKFTTGADVALEIRDQGGTLLASGTYVVAAGALHATTGAVPNGTYKIGVRYVSGGTVPSYLLQVFVSPSMDARPVSDWTAGRPYDLPLGVADGIAPYTLATKGGPMPPGLGLNSETLRATGTPTTVGDYPVTIELRDSGDPVSIVSRSETVTINDVLTIGVARFVGFPAGRAIDTALPTIEGTPPFTLTMPSGALPEGLAFAPDSLHVTGTAAAQPSVNLELDGVDVAGSADHIATRAVVAAATDVTNAPTDLAAGDDACGWWFDAVQGSAVSFKAKTAKGRVKRLIAAAVLAPDRSEVLTARVKGKLGGLSVSKLVCPLSGRYYVIAASSEGEATQLLGSVAVNPSGSGKAKLVDFTQTDTTTVEVGALPGATLTLKFKGDKKQQLTPKIVSVTDPDGTPAIFGGNVVIDGVAGTLTMTLAEGGTWTIVLGATSATGTPGKLSYSYKLAQPKDAEYSAD
jgi:hypothetical protein